MSKTDLEILVPKTIAIEVLDRSTGEQVAINISEMVLGERIKFLDTFLSIMQQVFKEGKSLVGLDNSAIAEVVMKASGDKLPKLYSTITGKEESWLLNNLTVKNEVALWLAFFEVNDIPLLVSQVRTAIPTLAARIL